jgi:hypothetical protein
VVRTWHIGGDPCYHRAHACGQFWPDSRLQAEFDGWHWRLAVLSRFRGMILRRVDC